MAGLVSGVFETSETLYELLLEQAWPPHPTIPDPVVVLFGDAHQDELGVETVLVLGASSSPPEMEWATNLSQDEQFTLELVIGTHVKGRTRAEAWARIKELCAVPQQAVRSSSTGRTTGGFSTATSGVLWWTGTSIIPHLGAGPEGFVASAEMQIRFNGRI